MIREELSVDEERALLIGVQTPRQPWDEMAELERLTKTAGACVVARISQKRSRPRPDTYLGSGKVNEIASLVHSSCIDVVIADDDLTPIQVRNLEKALKIKVVDRSELILDIFATRAQTRQAKLQVELAQLEYGLNRLRRLWTHLERQEGASGGGLATRGPGEKQIEIDRRLARHRISELKKRLEEVGQQTKTSRRSRQGIFKASLVGYTNAGKSTLMRALTNEEVLVQDQLFSTLDTLTRSLDRQWPPCLMSDTVGFIRKLPKHLLSSFRSTLADVIEADLLLEVVDASDPDRDSQLRVVRRILRQIGVADKPRITIYNKVDQLDGQSLENLIQEAGPSAFYLSAHQGTGIEDLRDLLHDRARREAIPVWISVPASEGQWVSEILRRNSDHKANWHKDRLHVKVYLPEAEICRYEQIEEIRVERLEPTKFAKNLRENYTSELRTS